MSINDIIVLEKIVVLEKNEQEFIDYLMSSDCPYYFQNSLEHDKMFCHTFMNRDTSRKEKKGLINSSLYEHAEKLFLRICYDNNIMPKIILRSAINCTTASSREHTGIHIDHDGFTHYNFLLYLNDSSGDTLIYNDNMELVYRIEPVKNKVVIFKGCQHAQGSANIGDNRFVLVFTFTTEKDLI